MIDRGIITTGRQLPTLLQVHTLAKLPHGVFPFSTAIAKSLNTQYSYTHAYAVNMSFVGKKLTVDLHSVKPAISIWLMSSGHEIMVLGK